MGPSGTERAWSRRDLRSVFGRSAVTWWRNVAPGADIQHLGCLGHLGAWRVLDTDSLSRLREAIRRRAEADRTVLDELREEVRPLAAQVQEIKSRSATAVSVVAADGGNNRLEFDPYLMQVIRIVDSYGRLLVFDVISTSTDTRELSEAQFDSAGNPRTALGHLMKDLGVGYLHELSPMIPDSRRRREREAGPSWVQVYRDLCEWAALYHELTRTSFATDTLVVRDGLLRSKLFTRELFVTMCHRIEEAIERVYREDRRRVFLVGLAKRSKVLTRYQLAMAIEGILAGDYPCFVRVPRELEMKAFVWPEWAMSEAATEGSEVPKFVAGVLHFVRFGRSPHDQVWPVDILESQADAAPVILGYLLADAREGFPVPNYPRCLQKAHEQAALTGLDIAMLQDAIFEGIRDTLPERRRTVLDSFRLKGDGAALRYE